MKLQGRGCAGERNISLQSPQTVQTRRFQTHAQEPRQESLLSESEAANELAC